MNTFMHFISTVTFIFILSIQLSSSATVKNCLSTYDMNFAAGQITWGICNKIRAQGQAAQSDIQKYYDCTTQNLPPQLTQAIVDACQQSYFTYVLNTVSNVDNGICQVGKVNPGQLQLSGYYYAVCINTAFGNNPKVFKSGFYSYAHQSNACQLVGLGLVDNTC